MSRFKKLIQKFNTAQRHHSVFGFPFAVIKKYGEDETAYEAALITYYGFLSLFPLLLAVTTLLRITLQGHAGVRTKLFEHINRYAPIVGNELEHNIHSLPKTGLALIVALLVTLYGARGAAAAVRHAFSRVWHVPRQDQPDFWHAALNSLAIIVVGGGGLVLASLLSGEASALGRSGFVRIFSSLVSLVILLLMLWGLFRLATQKYASRKATLLSALIAAIGLQIIQSLGGYLVTHELRHLSTLYGTFALVLGLLFWLYLQVQTVLYATQCGIVYTLRLWPRSALGQATPADEQARALYAKHS